MPRTLYVYILTGTNHRVLYIGVTNSLRRRIPEHRRGKSIFSSRYHLWKLVYYEAIPGPMNAIRREKQLKERSREAKVRLIDRMNPDWHDLFAEL